MGKPRKDEEVVQPVRLTWPEFKVRFLNYVSRKKARRAGEELPEVDIDAEIPEEIQKEIEEELPVK